MMYDASAAIARDHRGHSRVGVVHGNGTSKTVAVSLGGFGLFL
jgi:hypothetical protein